MRAGFQHVSGEAVTKTMNCGCGNVELFAGDDDEALQRRARHGRGGLDHAPGQSLRGVVAAADVGKDQQRMAVKLPVALQFLPQAGGQRHDAVLMALAVANE